MAEASDPPSSSFSTSEYRAWLEVFLWSCTRNQTGVCQLLSCLTDFNAPLSQLGLQLREEDAGERPGDLIIATVPGTCQEYPFCNFCAHNEELGMYYLRCLLRVHRCIVSAEMNYGVANSVMVIEALASSSIRRLTIRGAELQDEREARLREPVPVVVGCLGPDYVYPNDCRATPVIPCLLQRNSGATLTSLDVAELEMTPSGVHNLITAFMENETVTELAVGHDVFARWPEDQCGVPFQRCLTLRNVPLQKLTLKTSVPLNVVGHLRSLSQTVSSMTTLKELYAQWPSRPELCEMFATVVFRSKTLLRVTLLFRNVDDGTVDLTPIREGELPRLQSWPDVLQKNCVLQNLELDVSWCRTTHCVRFLNALKRHHRSLKTLSLRNMLGEDCLNAVCNTIRKRGLGRRISIKDHMVDFGHAPIIHLYTEVTTVTVSSQFLAGSVSVLRNVFNTLVFCPHVTSLRLLLHSSSSPTFESLAAYIRGASTLKEIKLTIDTSSRHDTDDEDVAMDVDDIDESMTQAQQLVCQALCSNLNITKLHLDSRITLSDNDCRMFAEYATAKNERLYELSVKYVSSPGLFSRPLVPPFRRNYSLLLLEVPVCMKPDMYMYGAQDVVRRNCGLVERATRFLMGKHDRYGASALEFVSEHPKLVENFRLEAALPGDDEARDKIKRIMQILRRIDMHEFMRMTGVVERQVVCDYRDEDDRTQLDKLNYDCWTRVRQYLKLTDVNADWDLL